MEATAAPLGGFEQFWDANGSRGIDDGLWGFDHQLDLDSARCQTVARFRVVEQGEGTLDRRLAHVFSRCAGPTLLIGMDTPQVGPWLLEESISALEEPGVDAVLGHAEDGGYWAIGFRRPDPRAFAGVPMSVAETGARQEAALRALGLRLGLLPTLRDVDLIGDARAVAAMTPGGGFARALDEVESELCVS